MSLAGTPGAAGRLASGGLWLIWRGSAPSGRRLRISAPPARLMVAEQAGENAVFAQ